MDCNERKPRDIISEKILTIKMITGHFITIIIFIFQMYVIYKNLNFSNNFVRNKLNAFQISAEYQNYTLQCKIKIKNIHVQRKSYYTS